MDGKSGTSTARWPEAAPLAPAWEGQPPPARNRREVLRELALTDFRLKYYDSVRGYVWSMLSPLLMLLIYYFVFRYIIGVRTPGYLVYLVVGIVYWTFFQDCSFSGLTALGARAAVLKSVRLPASWVVIAGALSTTITLAINTVALIAVLAASGRLSPLFPLALLPLVLLVVLASGTSFLVAVAHVRFRDTGLIWSVLLQALFWLTPIVYTVAEGPLRNLLYLNPLARCLDLIRWFLVYGHLPPVRFVAVTAAASLATFALGAWLLRRQERAMPEAL